MAKPGILLERANGQFCINGVTGPDEYNTVVNNNAFTNLMARENLRAAARTLEQIRATTRSGSPSWPTAPSLSDSEIAEWQAAADRMCVPYDETAGIHLQDDDFLSRKPWDFANTPPDKYPLLLHFHPLVIYRHNVVKQADIVLAMFLLGNEFSLEQKRRNFDYYDPLTTGDSSLSVSIQSILAMELGYREKAIEYLRYALWMDLADVHANVEQGCHIASMGGTWMAVIYGVAGMRELQRPHHVPSSPWAPRRRPSLSSHHPGTAPDGGHRGAEGSGDLPPSRGDRAHHRSSGGRTNTRARQTGVTTLYAPGRFLIHPPQSVSGRPGDVTRFGSALSELPLAAPLRAPALRTSQPARY